MTSSLHKLVAWYLGIPQLPQGQLAAWRLRFTNLWLDTLPVFGLWLLAFGLIGSVAFLECACQRPARGLSGKQRFVLVLLRSSVLVLVLVLAGQPVLVVEKAERPWLAVLVDRSASMAFEDDYSEHPAQQVVAQLQRQMDGRPPTRWNLVRAILAGQEGGLLERMVHDFRVRTYCFADDVSRLDSDDSVPVRDARIAAQQFERVRPDGWLSCPGPALRKVLDDFDGLPLASVVVFSDGIASTGSANRFTAGTASEQENRIPIYAVTVGTSAEAPDLEITDVQVPSVVFQDDPILCIGQLRSRSMKAQAVTVQLRRAETDQVLARQTIQIETGGASQKARVFEIACDAQPVEELDLVLEVLSVPGEVYRSNNRVPFHVSVREGRLRVLLIDAAPRWEFRELKTFLERQKTIELHTILQEADPEYADLDRTARPLQGRFPSQLGQLTAYDVIILGDADPRQFGTDGLENLHQFVSERGGGMILVAGQRFNPNAYAKTPLEPLFPVTIRATRSPDVPPDVPEAWTAPFRLQWKASDIALVRLFRLGQSPARSRTDGNDLPPFYWHFPINRLRSAAVVLADSRTDSDAPETQPIIVLQRYGAGKVLFHATDELWRWRTSNQGLDYDRYWMQVIRFLAQAHLMGQTGRAWLTTDRTVYQHEDPVHFELRALGAAGRSMPDRVSLQVLQNGQLRQFLKLSKRTEEGTVFEGDLSGLADGHYHAVVSDPQFPDAAPTADFQVASPMRELQQLAADFRQMRQAALTTGGQAYTLADVERLPDELPTPEPVWQPTGDSVALWNRWEVMVLVIGLLATEWVLRRRWRVV